MRRVLVQNPEAIALLKTINRKEKKQKIGINNVAFFFFFWIQILIITDNLMT